MGKIDANTAFNTVSLAIHNAFPQAHIYSEDVEMELCAGDFCLIMPNMDTSSEIGSRCKKSYILDCVYYPPHTKPREDCRRVSEILFRILPSMTASDGTVLHGDSISASIVDGLLHVSVTVRGFTYVSSQADEMEVLSIEGKE